MSVPFEITVFRKDGGPLTKRISLALDGSIKSDGSQCIMSHGTARRFRFDGMQSFADLIAALKPNEAFATGSLRPDLPDRVEVVTRDRLNGAQRPGFVARTQTFIIHRAGEQEIALIDFDRKGMPPDVAGRIDAIGGFWAALVSVLPALAHNVARVERLSTSAGLYDARTGEPFDVCGGMHVYVLIKDGSDAERFLTVLHQRAWLNGFGWMMPGRAGQALERSIVDRVCGGPERLAFEGRPVLIHPVDQDLTARKPIAVEGEALDTLATCPPLTVVELAKLRELRAKERNRLTGDAAKAREAFVDRQSRQLAQRTGVDLHHARRTIERQCEGVLLPDIELPFDDEELVGKTVSDVLADPARFDGETLADPLEGIDYGRCKARIMRRPDGSVWINSFAHGRTTYELKVDFPAAKTALKKTTAEGAAETLERVVSLGDLGDDEVEILRNLAHTISGVGKRTLDRKLKKVRRVNPDSEHHADLVKAFNVQYAVVNEAGKAMVYERVRDPMLNRYVLLRSRFDDFKKFYQNQSVEISDGKRKTVGEFWLDHPNRRQYLGGVVFDPTNKVGQVIGTYGAALASSRSPATGVGCKITSSKSSAPAIRLTVTSCSTPPPACSSSPTSQPKWPSYCAAKKGQAKGFSASISSKPTDSMAHTSPTRSIWSATSTITCATA